MEAIPFLLKPLRIDILKSYNRLFFIAKAKKKAILNHSLRQ